MSVSYSCKSCEKLIRENKNSLQSNLWETWIHLKCNHLNFIDYRKLPTQTEACHCFSSYYTIFPLGKLNNQQFHKFLHHGENMSHSITVEENI